MNMMLEVIERDKELWIPGWLDGAPDPPEVAPALPDRNVHVNLVPGEIEVADEATLAEELERFGRIREEPEIGRARSAGLIPEAMEEIEVAVPSLLQAQVQAEQRVSLLGYADTYWTHFDWRPDVARAVVALQKLFPWLTYMNTYFKHPPVFGRLYEFVSRDVWQGGVRSGKYLGYRGKPLDPELGRKVFNATFYRKTGPPIYYIIYRGRMWTRGYGWGPAPGGPADSDPDHDWHIHETDMLVY